MRGYDSDPLPMCELSVFPARIALHDPVQVRTPSLDPVQIANFQGLTRVKAAENWRRRVPPLIRK